MAQLTEGHIWAVDMVHEDHQKYLIGCGAENGEIGLWRPGLDKPVRMRIHNKSITGKIFQGSLNVADQKFTTPHCNCDLNKQNEPAISLWKQALKEPK